MSKTSKVSSYLGRLLAPLLADIAFSTNEALANHAST
jgi:hypothetical protein